jgi:hypothetical protein
VKPKARTPLVELLVALAHMLALAGVLRALEPIVGQNPFALPIAGAIAAELIAANVGVTWGELDGKPASLGDLVRAAGRGALPVVAAVAIVVLVARLAGVAEVDAGHPSATHVFALVRAVALGARDELLFRGIPLAAAERAKIPRAVAIAFGVLAGGASLLFVPSVTPVAIALEICSGLAFALLWRYGTVAGVAAHATWALLIGAGLHGTFLEIAWTRGALAVGPHADGPPAVIGGAALLACAFAAVTWSRRTARCDSTDPPAAP